MTQLISSCHCNLFVIHAGSSKYPKICEFLVNETRLARSGWLASTRPARSLSICGCIDDDPKKRSIECVVVSCSFGWAILDKAASSDAGWPRGPPVLNGQGHTLNWHATNGHMTSQRKPLILIFGYSFESSLISTLGLVLQIKSDFKNQYMFSVMFPSI